MNLTFFVSLLSNELKTEYYEEIIKYGQVSEELWTKICNYLKEGYKAIYNVEEEIVELLKNLEDVEKSRLMMSIQESNIYLFNKICTKLLSFEDIISIDKSRVENAISKLDMDITYKAIQGASPKVIKYIQSIFPDIDLLEERSKLGSIKIDEIIQAQDILIEKINNNN